MTDIRILDAQTQPINLNGRMATRFATMKNLSLALVAATSLALASCGGSEPTTPEGKKTKLEELQKEQARIATEIAKLEQEIGEAKNGKEASADDKPKAVTVSTVTSGPFKHYVEVQGQVESDNVVTVNAKTMGTLDAVLVKEGDHVTKGQALARVDNAVLRNNIAQVQTQLDVAENLFQRQKALWDQKIGSEVQYINAKAQRDGLVRQIATLREQLNQSTVTAPLSGTVDKVNARVGENAQNPLGLFRVVNLNDLKVVGDVSETYLQYLRKGAPVEVEFPELKQTISGTVSFVASVVDPTSRTLRVEVRVHDSRLRPNMIAKLRVNDQTLKNAVTIDQNLVQNSEKGPIVFVAVEKEGKKVVESRAVKTGLSYNGRIEILSGLKAGDQVISTGYQDVTDNQVISY